MLSDALSGTLFRKERDTTIHYQTVRVAMSCFPMNTLTANFKHASLQLYHAKLKRRPCLTQKATMVESHFMKALIRLKMIDLRLSFKQKSKGSES
jgi:hypothetical protein